MIKSLDEMIDEKYGFKSTLHANSSVKTSEPYKPTPHTGGKPIYKTVKVFDCQWDPGMPDDVKEAFFDFHRDPFVGNDVYVDWTVHEDDTGYDDDNEWAIKRRLVDSWLLANGAEGRKEGEYHGETVLIKHWW